MKKLLSLLLFCFCFAAPSWAATTFYVAKTGSDSNSCTTAQTIGTPKLTIASGMTCLTAGAGDTLLIRAGTYTERFTQTQIPNGTSWTLATTISAYNNEAVIIKPTGTSAILSLVSSSPVQYLIFDGLVWDGTAKATINFLINLDGIDYNTNVHHIRFIRNEIRQAKMSGILAGRGANFLEIIDSKVHDNGVNNQYDHGIYLQSSDCLIEGNEIYSNSSAGIQIYTGLLNGTDRAHRNTIRRNVVRDNRFGIILGTGDSNQAIKNLVYNNNTTAQSYGLAVYSGCTNCKLYNNTVYGSTLEGIQVRLGSSNTTLRNNIAWNNPGSSAGTNIHDYVVTGTVSSNNLTADPSFIDAAGANFALSASSTNAINQGTAVAGITCNGTCDIGAFETITWASGKVPDSASDNTMVLTFTNNNAPPLLPAGTTCAGFAATKGAGLTNNIITGCNRTGQNEITLTLTDSYANGDQANFTYSTSSGNVTDSALIGNIKNQRLNAITSTAVSTSEIGGGSTPLLTQVSYRWESYGGSESAPDFTKTVNTPIVLPPNACARVRGQISNTVANFGSSGFALYAQRNGAGGYAVVANGPCNSTSICFAQGTGILPPELTVGATTEGLAGGGTFTAGGVQLNASETPNVTLTNGQDTELVAALCVGAGNSAGAYFDLRWYRAGGVALSAYTQTPRITIGGHTSQMGAR